MKKNRTPKKKKKGDEEEGEAEGEAEATPSEALIPFCTQHPVYAEVLA